MQIKDLKPNVRNPRKMSAEAREALKRSVEKYGDLSGFVYNRRTKNLISGHQKKGVSPENSKVTIDRKYEHPTKACTVAEGYISINGENFKYREVDADQVWETEAMLAANKHQGEWDNDILKMALADIPSLDYEAAGFKLPELRALGIELKPLAPMAPLNARQTEAQQEQSEGEQAEGSEAVEQTDEEYVASTPETTEQVPQERIPSMVNDSTGAFDAVQESTESKLVKHLVIIDCPNQDIKNSIREKLRADNFAEQHGVKIF